MRLSIPAFVLSIFTAGLQGQTLHVGEGFPYATLPAAAEDVQPGDTILIHGGTYPGGIYLEDLQGTAAAWIHIRAAEGDPVIFRGGTNAWQFTDAAYLRIQGISFLEQTGNGVNFDDGGTYASPAHHVIFESCTFRDIQASGNNDLLKLSGVDSFEVRSCVFLRGAAGGSGIDMVGCHDGIIHNCSFTQLGSNSIQAKGGCRNVRIEANLFEDGGARAINLGGSTGLPFFRPLDAPYEAADLRVYSNIFIGSEAPIAFVGCIRTAVVNNTLYLPGKWVMRILQENVDPDRFAVCGFNTFRNNIVFLDNRVNVTCNIGPDTAPETFTFSNNLWFHADQPGWPGPVLPAVEADGLIGESPRFADPVNHDFRIGTDSPVAGRGASVTQPTTDFHGLPFLLPRSIGACEVVDTTTLAWPVDPGYPDVLYGPNPATGQLWIRWPDSLGDPLRVQLVSLTGRHIRAFKPAGGASNEMMIDMPAQITGQLFIVLDFPRSRRTIRVVVN